MRVYGQDRVAAIEFVEGLTRLGEAAFGTLIGPGFLDHFVDATSDDLPTNIRVLVDALGDLADALHGNGEELDALARRALGAAGEVEACLEADSQERVVWSEPDAVAWAPVDVSGELASGSGTTARRPSSSLRRSRPARTRASSGAGSGSTNAREAVVGSPYDFPEQALLYVPRAMPDPRSDGFTERAADEIVSLLALSEGRALVLTSSYRALDVVPRARARPRAVRRARAGRGAARAAARAVPRRGRLGADRDVDLLAGRRRPGRVALAARDRQAAVLGARRPAARGALRGGRGAGGDWFRDYALPTAMLQLRQGFGRLIRGHADRGVVAILDPRLRTRPYGRASSARCPRCPIAEDPAAVAAFFGDQVRRFRLNGALDAAQKKPKTPQPPRGNQPRKVQAPQVRGGGGGSMRPPAARSSTRSPRPGSSRCSWWSGWSRSAAAARTIRTSRKLMTAAGLHVQDGTRAGRGRRTTTT